MKTVIIYLIGLSGTGKYTIAQEIAQHNYKVVDNHLINNPIFSLLNWDKFNEEAPFQGLAWALIAKIRGAVFEYIVCERENNYVLTNELLKTERRLYDRVKELAQIRKSIFVPVRLVISNDERAKRIASPGRAERFKSTVIGERKDLIVLEHENLLELDVTNLSAKEAAEQIIAHVGQRRRD